jgi:hypothetical protein
MNLKLLADPFPASDVEWRMQTAGEKNGKVWARVLAYINNRAIMERLDDVCGPENWRNEYRYEAGGAVLCGISIRVTQFADMGSGLTANAEWVTKWDGAENTDIEAVKGGLSNAMKRCGVQWGIGRYLYQLEEGFARVHDLGENYVGKKDGKYPAFHWDPPALPAWALPGGSGKPGKVSEAKKQAGAVTSDVTRDTQRQQSAPAVVSPAKVPEGMKLNGIRMATMSKEELEKLIKEKASDAKYSKHVAEAAKILASRTMEAKFAAEVSDQEASLPF